MFFLQPAIFSVIARLADDCGSLTPHSTESVPAARMDRLGKIVRTAGHTVRYFVYRLLCAGRAGTLVLGF
jgi:hypothetical protein